MAEEERSYGLGIEGGTCNELELLLWANAKADNDVIDANNALKQPLEGEKLVAAKRKLGVANNAAVITDYNYETMVGEQIAALRMNRDPDNVVDSIPGEVAYKGLTVLARTVGSEYLFGQIEAAETFSKRLPVGELVHTGGVTYSLADVPEGVEGTRLTRTMNPDNTNSGQSKWPGGISVGFKTWGRIKEGSVQSICVTDNALIGLEAIEARLKQRQEELLVSWDYKSDRNYVFAMMVIQNYKTIGQPDQAAALMDRVTSNAFRSISELKEVGAVTPFVESLLAKTPEVFSAIEARIAVSVASSKVVASLQPESGFIDAVLRLSNSDFAKLTLRDRAFKRAELLNRLRVQGNALMADLAANQAGTAP